MNSVCTWIIAGLLAFFLLSGTGGCYPTTDDVKDFQKDEQSFVKALIDAHDKNMSDQHGKQTPAVAGEIEALRAENAKLFAQLLEGAHKKVDEHQSSLPVPDLSNLFSGGIGSAIMALFLKGGKSRAEPQIKEMGSDVSKLASMVAELKGLVNGLKPGTIA